MYNLQLLQRVLATQRHSCGTVASKVSKSKGAFFIELLEIQFVRFLISLDIFAVSKRHSIRSYPTGIAGHDFASSV